MDYRVSEKNRIATPMHITIMPMIFWHDKGSPKNQKAAMAVIIYPSALNGYAIETFTFEMA